MPSFIKLIKLSRKLKGSIENGKRHRQQWETMGIRHRQQWDTMGIRKTRTNITRKLKSRATRTLPYKTGMNPGAHEG